MVCKGGFEPPKSPVSKTGGNGQTSPHAVIVMVAKGRVELPILDYESSVIPFHYRASNYRVFLSISLLISKFN